MDSLSIVIVLLVTFLAYQQGIPWLFWGSVLLFVVTVRQPSVIIVFGLGLLALQFLRLQDFWFIILAIIVAFVLMTQKEQPKPAGGEELYSPELMELLGGK
ncbi:MAG: hypothetical protein J4432_01095 [DPANN group archaeon]|nr:hypothetical protein [DPANN group archaeon]